MKEVIAMRMILAALSITLTASCATERIVYRDVVPYVGPELRRPVPMPATTATDPARRAAEGVTNLLIHVDRLEGDRATVDCILGQAEGKAAVKPQRECGKNI
tara:strand:- start:288 stop:596 length:309 start_codon:yes stop_codon:yes gene_type:complete